MTPEALHGVVFRMPDGCRTSIPTAVPLFSSCQSLFQMKRFFRLRWGLQTSEAGVGRMWQHVAVVEIKETEVPESLDTGYVWIRLDISACIAADI